MTMKLPLCVFKEITKGNDGHKDGQAWQENDSLLFLFHDYKMNKEYIAYTNNYTIFFF